MVYKPILVFHQPFCAAHKPFGVHTNRLESETGKSILFQGNEEIIRQRRPLERITSLLFSRSTTSHSSQWKELKQI